MISERNGSFFSDRYVSSKEDRAKVLRRCIENASFDFHLALVLVQELRKQYEKYH